MTRRGRVFSALMQGLYAHITREGGSFTAIIYDGTRKQAIVEGSWRWVRTGLLSLGLTPPIGRFPEHGDSWLALVGSEPPRGLTERAG